MSVNKTLFGQARIVPETNETGWGAEVTGQLGDLLDGADEVLHKNGTAILIRHQSEDSTLAASATLTPTKTVHRVAGSGGAVTLDTTTAIASGNKDGQLLILEGTSDTNTVTIQSGANVQLNGDVVLAQDDKISLRWDATRGDWIEIGRNS